MLKQKTFIFSLLTLIAVAGLNYFGSKFNWYWTYEWFDIPMHMLGGLWVSLIALSLYSFFYKNVSIIGYRMKVFSVVTFTVLFIGISWEIFELVGRITSFNDNGYWSDTIGDIINDFIGGMVAYFFYIRKRKCEVDLICENKEIIK